MFKTKCKEKKIENDENTDSEGKGRLKKDNKREQEERKKRYDG